MCGASTPCASGTTRRLEPDQARSADVERIRELIADGDLSKATTRLEPPAAPYPYEAADEALKRLYPRPSGQGNNGRLHRRRRGKLTGKASRLASLKHWAERSDEPRQDQTDGATTIPSRSKTIVSLLKR